MKNYQGDCFSNDKFAPCGRCESGWIDLKPQQCGWHREPARDTREAYCWRTAGGVLYWHPKWEKPLVISVLCNCVRRAMHINETTITQEVGNGHAG